VKSFATDELFRARKAMLMALVDELGEHSLAIDVAPHLGKVRERTIYSRSRRGLLRRLSPGLASSIVDKVYLHSEDQLLRELSLQLRA
jgi:ClpP class serine protease